MALLHAAVILGVSFSSGLAAGGDQAPQVDVLLVTRDIPEARNNPQAAYLSQRTQLGAGNTDEHHPPGSPASRGAPENAVSGPQSAAAPGTTQPSAPERVLVSTAPSPDIRYFGQVTPEGGTLATDEPPGELPGDPQSGRGDAVELLLRGPRNNERWISPDTRASALAPYLAEWKRKVERLGTLNFPSAARAGLSGSPIVEVEIDADGRLTESHVRRSSGYGALDQAALTILRLASPFNPFPPELAAQYARLRFAYQWDFVAGGVTASPTAESPAAPVGPIPATGNSLPAQ
jgi:periplasmic protein TonB